MSDSPHEPTPPTRRSSLSDRARSGGRTPGGKQGRPFIVSVALHVVVAAVVLRALTFGHGIPSWLDPFSDGAPVEERITYVEPKSAAPAPVVPPAAPVRTATDRPAVTAPSTGPVLGPPGPTTPPAPRDTGSAVAGDPGNGVGAVDPNLRGVRPGYTDTRVWAGQTGDGRGSTGRGRNGAERLDSVISSVLVQAADSLDSIARANGAYGRAPGDWTKTDKNGRKWGWDNAGIRLGKVTIPNALLTLLPLNAQNAMSSNPTAVDRERRLAQSRADIQRNMTMGPGDAEFRKLANELRERRERERRDRLRAPSADMVTAPQKSGN